MASDTHQADSLSHSLVESASLALVYHAMRHDALRKMYVIFTLLNRQKASVAFRVLGTRCIEFIQSVGDNMAAVQAC